MKPERPFSQQAWSNTPEEVQRAYEALEKAVEVHSEQIAKLTKKVEELEARLGQNSSNSSRPPSSDPTYAKPVKQAKKAKRKRGAKKGHKGHHRKLLPPSKVVEVKPLACRCGCTDFTGHKTSPSVGDRVRYSGDLLLGQLETPSIALVINPRRLTSCASHPCNELPGPPTPWRPSKRNGIMKTAISRARQ